MENTYFIVGVERGEKDEVLKTKIIKNLQDEEVIPKGEYIGDLWFGKKLFFTNKKDLYEAKVQKSPYGHYVWLTDTKVNGALVSWKNTNGNYENYVFEDILSCAFGSECEKEKQNELFERLV